MKRTMAVMTAGLIVLLSGTVLAGDKHPNLTRASEALNNAKNAVTAAQVANEFDLDGHAAKAKALIEQALDEVGKARAAANH